MPDTTDHTLHAGGFDFRVRVYPAPDPNGSVLVWLHGGAFMFGTLDMPEADQVGRRLSEAGTTVVSVDYTLGPLDALAGLPGPEEGAPGPSPEQFAAELAAAGPRSPYPTASLQTVAAFEWARANAHTWGADPTRVSLGGASAGGNLSAGAAVRLRDAGGDAPASLLLVYPVLHSELPAADPELVGFLNELPAALTFPPKAMRAINASYLGGASPDDVYAFPGGHDMRGMPRTLIVTAERDQLRTSAEAFAADLALGGVDVALFKERGALHGYLNEVGDDAAEHTLALMADVLSD
ncbi:Acetyl esterase/lipase [Microbacterium sp. cf046]|uniref:alpha/beta hydrolase n=1 Tax=Microbacterium sp. cf046 TaxID=1761803 RepID=UPI0008ED48D0|nr:alpha/beta hydrolase [Microbacterium sp. cf046]SFS13104.1 Acetyl esterase/lipase [Microbacterium sp. cf046]